MGTGDIVNLGNRGALYPSNTTQIYLKLEVLIMSASESKRERFVRLAEARTNKILDMLKLLGNCASTSNYEYTEEDVKKIFTAIEREMKNTRAKFNGTDTQKEDRFTLS